jgi:hypothetical protein
MRNTLNKLTTKIELAGVKFYGEEEQSKYYLNKIDDDMSVNLFHNPPAELNPLFIYIILLPTLYLSCAEMA